MIAWTLAPTFFSAARSHFFFVVLQYGGFGKTPEQLPDLYHAYYGFCAFSLLEEPGLNSICTELGITNGPVQLLWISPRAHDHKDFQGPGTIKLLGDKKYWYFFIYFFSYFLCIIKLYIIFYSR